MSRRLTIRETEDRDHDAVLNVVRDAFERDDEARLVSALWREDAFSLDLLAEEDGAVIGHCGFSVVEANPPLKGAALGLAPLSVTPARQRSGVGSALVETGLDICKTRGASLMVVLGDPHYYARFGFEPASSQGVTWAEHDAGDAFRIIDWAGIGGAERKIHYHPLFSSV